NSFGAIDAMLKKRYDLLPNLIATVKEYMKHEAGVLTEITALRAQATSGNISTEDKVMIENQLAKKVSGIMVAVENYPDLKANTNFLQLQASWNEIEEQISAARRAFNAMVTEYNNSVETFPTNLIAKMMGFKRKSVFEIAEAERQNISAKNLFNS
ncbi:MAG TPA: LemA family protein, partial [Bacteroidales bacterium]|nr:LemA family protein [Bacteroidales bacterium]